jgi:hypothetical protein
MSLGWNAEFTEFATKHHGLGITHTASLSGWSSAANALFATGCEPQAFAMLASLATPLMALFPGEDGGAVVSIFGGRKSGKSVALTAAATVWGLPQGLMLDPKDRFPIIENLRNLPVITGDMARMDPIIAYEFIGKFLLPKEPKWATILLCFGGQALNEAIRGPDIPFKPANPPIVTEFGLHVPRGLIEPDKGRPSMLERRLLDNRGTAGRAFLDRLIDPPTILWCRKMLASKYALMVDKYRRSHEWRFHMRAIAAVWVAGMLCVDAGILELSPDRIAHWAMAEVLSKRKPK